MTLNCTHEDVAARPCGECRSCRLTVSGNHPDLLYSQLDPNTGALKIEEIRTITQRIALKPYQARYRIAILGGFENAQPRAQDALLKTLEEPPPHALLLVLTQSTEPILPTITSRSQTLHLRLLPVGTVFDVLVNAYHVERQQAELLAHLSGGRIGWALQALQQSEFLEQRSEALRILEDLLGENRAERFKLAEGLGKEKLALRSLLELWQTYWRDLLLLVTGSMVEIVNIDHRETLERFAHHFTAEEAVLALQATAEALNNLKWAVNTRLLLEVLFLDYPGLQH